MKRLSGLAILLLAHMAWAHAAVSDFDNDGRSDVFWRNGATGENYLNFMSWHVQIPLHWRDRYPA